MSSVPLPQRSVDHSRTTLNDHGCTVPDAPGRPYGLCRLRLSARPLTPAELAEICDILCYDSGNFNRVIQRYETLEDLPAIYFYGCQLTEAEQVEITGILNRNPGENWKVLSSSVTSCI